METVFVFVLSLHLSIANDVKNCSDREPMPQTMFAEGILGVRLKDGRSNCSGTLQVQGPAPEDWAGLCARTFSWASGHVVCRQLGCGPLFGVVTGRYFGPGGGRRWEDRLECRGNETGLGRCLQVNATCFGPERVGIICSDDHSEVRLRDADGGKRDGGKRDGAQCSGRVWVYTGVGWVRLVKERWDPLGAEELCRRVGCGPLLSLQTQPLNFPPDCRGQHVYPCPPNLLDGFGAEITCAARREAASLAFALAGGPSRCSGRARVFLRGSWLGVSARSWAAEDTEAVCRHLGCLEPRARPETGREWSPRAPSLASCRREPSLLSNRSLWVCAPNGSEGDPLYIRCPGHVTPTGGQDGRQSLAAWRAVCLLLLAVLVLAASLGFGPRVYRTCLKPVFQRKPTHRQWIGPTGATSNSVSYHRRMFALETPSDHQPPDKSCPYPGLERLHRPITNIQNLSGSEYDFFNLDV